MGDTCVLGKKISAGTYGVVYEIDLKTVTKVYKKDPTVVTEIESSAEIDILFRLRSPYLLQGTGIFLRKECGEGTGFAIKLERLIGSVSDLFQGNISYTILKKVLLHLALGLRCLHRSNYLHLDIGVNNCLYMGSAKAPVGKLIDFGLAAATERGTDGKLMPVHTTQVRITATYRPPECFVDENTYTDKADIWSLGMVFLELLSRTRIVDYTKDQILNAFGIDYDAMSHREILKLTDPKTFRQTLTARLRTVALTEHPKLINLLVNMLNQDPGARYDIEEVIDDPYFNDVKPQVKDATGDQCLEVYVEPMRPVYAFEGARRQGLRYLLDLVDTHWANASVEFLFNAVDVYMRTVTGVGPQAKEDELKSVALVSLFVAHRIFYSVYQLPKVFSEKTNPLVNAAWALEDQVYKLLGGIIRRSYLYAIAANANQLRYVYDNLFRTGSTKDLSSYLSIELAGYMALIGQAFVDSPKQITVARFHELFAVTPAKATAPAKVATPAKVTAPAKVATPAQPEVKAVDRYDVDAAYASFIHTLTGPFAVYHTAFFMMAVDFFVQYVHQLLESKTPVSLDQLREVANAAIIAAHIQTYQQEALPEGFRKEELPKAWTLKDTIFKAPSSNPLYVASQTPDELRVFYVRDMLGQDREDHYTIFDTAPTIKTFEQGAEKMAAIRTQYQVRSEPKEIAIETLMGRSKPQKRGGALPKSKA